MEGKVHWIGSQKSRVAVALSTLCHLDQVTFFFSCFSPELQVGSWITSLGSHIYMMYQCLPVCFHVIALHKTISQEWD